MPKAADNENRTAQIKRTLDERNTEELLRIWEENDREGWSEEAFIAIEQILLERLGEVPAQPSNPGQKEPAVEDQPRGPVDTLDDPVQIARAEENLKEAGRLVLRGKYAQALEACDSAARLAPNLASVQTCRGQILTHIGNLVQAAEAYQAALRMDPGYKAAQEGLADVYLEQAVASVGAGELEIAIQFCDQAVSTDPGFVNAYNYRGMIFEELEQYADAIDNYSRAVQLDPEFSAGWENLYHARVKWEESLFQADEELLDQPDSGELSVSTEPEEAEPVFSEELPVTNQTFEQYAGRVPALYLDEQAILLRGWPGHRNRPGRSGLDYIENEAELGRLQGLVLRQLFTGTFRTDNPLMIFILLFFGLFCNLSLLFTLIEMANGNPSAMLINIFFSPLIALGIALLFNAGKSVSELKTDDRADSGPDDETYPSS